MNKNTLEKLEFNKIKEKLSQYCITYLGKKKVSELEPKNKKEEVQKRLQDRWPDLQIRLLRMEDITSAGQIEEIENDGIRI